MADELKVDGAFLQLSAKLNMASAMSQLAACYPTDYEKLKFYATQVTTLLGNIEEHLAGCKKTMRQTLDMVEAMESGDMERAMKIGREMGFKDE